MFIIGAIFPAAEFLSGSFKPYEDKFHKKTYTNCLYIFCCLVYNMIYMLFNYNMVVDSTFWLEYFLIIILQGVLSIVLAIFDSIVEMGIDE